MWSSSCGVKAPWGSALSRRARSRRSVCSTCNPFGDGRMTMTAERKVALVKEYATKAGDTGSPEAQVAILTERINTLTDHFKAHKKDNHSRRGLLKMVSQRRGLLDYLKKVDEGRYQSLIKRLDIRRYIDTRQE